MEALLFPDEKIPSIPGKTFNEQQQSGKQQPKN